MFKTLEVRSQYSVYGSKKKEFRLMMLLVKMIWVFYNQVMMLIGKEMECVLRKYAAICKHITVITVCAGLETLCNTCWIYEQILRIWMKIWICMMFLHKNEEILGRGRGTRPSRPLDQSLNFA